MGKRTIGLAICLLAALTAIAGCHTPQSSQRYFAEAAAEDPLLEPIHETPLYTVYYDHGLGRCVVHSAHTWGQTGGGGGGTGIGIAIFKCDPVRLKARVQKARAQGVDTVRVPGSSEKPKAPSPSAEPAAATPLPKPAPKETQPQ